MTKSLKYLLVLIVGLVSFIPVDGQVPTSTEIKNLITENSTWKLRRIEADGQMYSVPAEMQGTKMVFQNDKNYFTYQPSETDPVAVLNYVLKENILVSYSNTEYNSYEVQFGDVVTQLKLRELSDPMGAVYVWEPAETEATSHLNFILPDQRNSFYPGTAKAKDLVKKINGKMKMAEGNFIFYESGEIPITVQNQDMELTKNGLKITYVLNKKEEGKLPTTYIFNFSPKDIDEVVDYGTHKDSPLGLARIKLYAHTAFRTDFSTKKDVERAGVNYVNLYYLNIRENSFKEVKDYLLALKKEQEQNPGKLDQFFDLVTTETFWESHKGSSNKYTLVNGGVLSDNHIYLTFSRSQIHSDGRNSDDGYLVKFPVSNILYYEKPEAHKADPYTRFPILKVGGIEYYKYNEDSRNFKSVGDYGMRFPIFVELDEEDESLLKWIKYLFEHSNY